MKDTYSDDVLEALKGNPNVKLATKRRIELTLEFRQRMYDAWTADPGRVVIRKFFKENGIDPSVFSPETFRHFNCFFKRYGRPEKKIYKTGPKKYSTKSPEQRSDEDQLLATGKFINVRGAVTADRAFVQEIFVRYPEQSVEDAFRNAGIPENKASQEWIKKLRQDFRMYAQAGSSPGESRNSRELLSDEDRKVFLENPFVEKIAHASLIMTRSFYKCGALLAELPVDVILDAFMLDHTKLAVRNKAAIKSGLLQQKDTMPINEAVGNTVFDACLLRRRAAALSETADREFSRIHRLVPSMSAAERKVLCKWIETIAKNPYSKSSLTEMLAKVGISRNVYYRYLRDPGYGKGKERAKEKDDALYGYVHIAYEYKGFHKGARQVYMLVPRLTGKKIGLRKVRQIMREHGMTSGIRKPNPARRAMRERTKNGIKPNLLRRTFRLHRPNEVRVTDVTYLDYGAGLRAYGSALMDPVTSRLIAFNVSEKNDLELTIESLRRGDRYPCVNGGIFHSDQGTLYQLEDFQKEILDRGLEQSMSKRGNCWDNATQESFFGHFKDECDYRECRDIEELKKKIDEYVYYYNNERGIWEKGRMTPAEYENYLTNLNDEEFADYLAGEEERYNEMKRRAAALAKKRYGTLGV